MALLVASQTHFVPSHSMLSSALPPLLLLPLATLIRSPISISASHRYRMEIYQSQYMPYDLLHACSVEAAHTWMFVCVLYRSVQLKVVYRNGYRMLTTMNHLYLLYVGSMCMCFGVFRHSVFRHLPTHLQ